MNHPLRKTVVWARGGWGRFWKIDEYATRDYDFGRGIGFSPVGCYPVEIDDDGKPIVSKYTGNKSFLE
jgi:hypothetical protein